MANAVSIASDLGGVHYGFLGITTEPALYITIMGHIFMNPTNPGFYPFIANTAYKAVARTIQRQYRARLNQWKTFNQVY